jgi:hypothetical protein
VLFLLAPALNLLRFDLTEAQLWFLGSAGRWASTPSVPGSHQATRRRCPWCCAASCRPLC